MMTVRANAMPRSRPLWRGFAQRKTGFVAMAVVSTLIQSDAGQPVDTGHYKITFKRHYSQHVISLCSGLSGQS